MQQNNESTPQRGNFAFAICLMFPSSGLLYAALLFITQNAKGIGCARALQKLDPTNPYSSGSGILGATQMALAGIGILALPFLYFGILTLRTRPLRALGALTFGSLIFINVALLLFLRSSLTEEEKYDGFDTCAKYPDLKTASLSGPLIENIFFWASLIFNTFAGLMTLIKGCLDGRNNANGICQFSKVKTFFPCLSKPTNRITAEYAPLQGTPLQTYDSYETKIAVFPT